MLGSPVMNNTQNARDYKLFGSLGIKILKINKNCKLFAFLLIYSQGPLQSAWCVQTNRFCTGPAGPVAFDTTLFIFDATSVFCIGPAGPAGFDTTLMQLIRLPQPSVPNMIPYLRAAGGHQDDGPKNVSQNIYEHLCRRP